MDVVDSGPSRDEIIVRFRQRIAGGERSKLGKQERAALAAYFVERLALCGTEDEVSALCRAEIALLEEGYPVGSIANQYLPEWRKAIAAAVEQGQLPRQELEPNEFGKIYPHWGLKHLLYANEVYKSLKEQTTTFNNQKQDNLQPVDAEQFLAKAVELLQGENPYEWGVGLLAVTGRRFSEIVAKGGFSATAHPYAIAFRGQLKKGVQSANQEQTFLIATLVKGDKVIGMIDKFRESPRIRELAGLDPDELNSRLNTSIRHVIKREFEVTGIVPVLVGEKGVSSHNLRGCYAEVAVHLFCPPNQATHRFVQAHLGHIIGERELGTRKNAGATEHYFHYRLAGALGQQLNEKGILLEKVGNLPLTVELDPTQLELTAGVEDVDSLKPRFFDVTREDERAMPISSPEPLSQTRRSRTQVPAELMHQLREVAALKLKAVGSNTEVLLAVVDFLQDEKTPTLAVSLEALGTTFNWFTQEVERLREDYRGLALQHKQVLVELRAVQGSTHNQGELERLRAENERLRAEVNQFQQVKQMLGAQGMRESATPGAIPVTRLSTLARTAGDRVTPQPQRRGGGKATDLIDQAISLVMSWNDDPRHQFEHRWFISVPSILTLIRGSGASASQGSVQEAMARRKDEISQHHAAHGLGQRHNARHPYTITDDIRL
jgi:integrase